MVSEDSGFQKSMEILVKKHRKGGPKKIRKNDAKVGRKGTKAGARNRSDSEKKQKRAIQKSMRKRDSGKTSCIEKGIDPVNPLVRKPGRRGRDLGRGSGWFQVGSRVVLKLFNTPSIPVGAADVFGFIFVSSAPRGRLRLLSLTFWCDVKKPSFFDRPKID